MLLASGAATLMLGSGALAKPGGSAGVSARARALYKRAYIFDANMAPPFADPPYPQGLIDVVRSSGVNAVKTSFAGTHSGFEDAVAELAYAQRFIDENPSVFQQIRVADEPKRSSTLS